jgi:hypothetical protein
MSYTKEKWFFDENDYSVCTVKNGEELEVCNISSIDEGGIKRFHRGEESQANAMLITAAPALLEALEEITLRLKTVCDILELDWSEDPEIAKSDNAIKQARGEQ